MWKKWRLLLSFTFSCISAAQLWIKGNVLNHCLNLFYGTFLFMTQHFVHTSEVHCIAVHVNE